ncbi:hypothetical protein Tdes44962_MAKER01160 [Teratosphaeria destructans]|uniref:Mucin n=1 Tax=Teratosphaeria destructans TaxID=418781 RepID=A0A9W7T1T5_9PEZI|nr:hypothetical protein Tdes44962_MAKER01160 [Teratosphaeria destructans]
MIEPALRLMSNLTSSPARQNRRRRSSSEARADTMISPEEYAVLPASIQRKYFSSVERLRIAQHAAVDKRKKQRRQDTWSPSSSMADLTRKAPTHDDLETRPASSWSPKFTTMDLETNYDEPITQEQAQWFLSLPYKFRKQHFSRDEMLLLTQHSRDVLQGVYDKPEQALTHSERRASMSSQCRNSTDSDSVDKESRTTRADNTHDNCTASTETEELSRQLSEVSRLESELAFFPTSSTRRSSTTTTASARPKSDKPKRKSFRALSLIPVALPPPTLSPVPTLPTVNVRNFSRLSKSATERSPRNTVSPAPAKAKYYQDPDARRQLRTYLASAQKFDELLEFGWPSTSPTPSTSASSTHRSESAMSHDSADTRETRGPATPTLNLDQMAVQPAFHDNAVGLPLHLDDPDARSDQFSDALDGCRREMTIRMTLTRPELHSNCGDSKPQIHEPEVDIMEADPLALEPLPVCEDATGAHGAFAIHLDGPQKKALGKVWKTLRRR